MMWIQFFGKWTAPIWENMAYCRNWVTVKVKMIKIWRAWIGRFPVPNFVTIGERGSSLLFWKN